MFAANKAQLFIHTFDCLNTRFPVFFWGITELMFKLTNPSISHITFHVHYFKWSIFVVNSVSWDCFWPINHSHIGNDTHNSPKALGPTKSLNSLHKTFLWMVLRMTLFSTTFLCQVFKRYSSQCTNCKYQQYLDFFLF